MSTFEVPDLDSSTEKDWRRFATQLADLLASDGRLTEFSVTPAFLPEGAGRLEMLFRTTTRGTLVCVSSGLSTPPDPWRRSDVPEIHVLEQDSAWVDHFASTVITEIRHTWNTPHPSFLVGSVDGALRRGVFGTEGSTVVAPSFDAKSPSSPSTEAELVTLVHAALRTLPGTSAHSSDDGSLHVESGSVTAYVYVAALDEVRVHAPIVERIGGRTRAAELVADLNRRHPRLKFLLVEDRVHVAMSIDAQPFVPHHLIEAMGRLTGFLAHVDHAFADNLGGVLTEPAAPGESAVAAPTEPQDESESVADDDVPPQLMTLLELDAESGGAIGPHDIVSICGRDRVTIARYERFCVEQAQSWKECAREARVRGEGTAAAECDSEAVPWDRIVRALQLALRTVGFYDNA